MGQAVGKGIVIGLAMLALPFAVAADNTPQKRGLYWTEGDDHHYTEFCSDEQRRLAVDFDTKAARAEVREREADLKNAEAELANLDAKFAPLEKKEPAMARLKAARAALAEAVKWQAEAVKAVRNAPIVNCSKTSSKNRQPAWAGAKLPENFVPANYRPQMDEVPWPDLPGHYCSLAAQQAAIKAFHTSGGFKAFLVATENNHNYALRYASQLRDLRTAYVRSGQPGFNVYVDRIDVELREYEGVIRILNDAYTRAWTDSGFRKVRIDPHGPGCTSEANNAPAIPDTTSRPTGPTKPATGTANNAPGKPAKDAKCENQGGLMGAPEEETCEIEGSGH
jgi:hypothetical protein